MTDLPTIYYPPSALGLGDLWRNEPYFPPSAKVAAVVLQSVTNAQKLSMTLVPAAEQAAYLVAHPGELVIDYGQSVSVSDGFLVSGDGDPKQAGYYFPTGATYNDKPVFSTAAMLVDNNYDVTNYCNYSGTGWVLRGVEVTGNEDSPWQVDWASVGITLTHPAIQTLTTPSTAQGGVFVTGAGNSDANGIFTVRGASTATPSRHYYNLLGQPDDEGHYAIGPTGSIDGSFWTIYDGFGNALYAGMDDVATPDLVTTWLDASAVVGVAERFTVEVPTDPTPALAAASPAAYFEFVDGDLTELYVWLNVEGGNDDPSATGHGIEVDLAVGSSAFDVVNAITSAINGAGRSVTALQSGTVVEITNTVAASVTDASDYTATWDIGRTVTQQGVDPVEGSNGDVPTVSSILQGELDAGVRVSGAGLETSNGAYPIYGATPVFNKRQNYTKPDNSSSLINNTETGPWSVFDGDSQYLGSGDFAFPWQDSAYATDSGVAPAPTVARNDVASEANWSS